jgi:hypothetical protein
MATRIYVAKYGVNAEWDDEKSPAPALEAWHYIDALRSGESTYTDAEAAPSSGGLTYADEVGLLRQWIMPLNDYIQKFGSEALGGEGESTLYLNVSFGAAKQAAAYSKTLYRRLIDKDKVKWTRRALLIFGNYTTLGTSSTLAQDLQTDPNWQKIKTICAEGEDGYEPMFATYFDKHFGTDHKKLFIMIGSQRYEGKAKEGFPIRAIWNNDKEVDARKLDRWIVEMARMGYHSKQVSFGKKNLDWLPQMPAVLKPAEKRDHVLEDLIAESKTAEAWAALKEATPNPLGVTKADPAFRPKKVMPKDLLEPKKLQYPDAAGRKLHKH